MSRLHARWQSKTSQWEAALQGQLASLDKDASGLKHGGKFTHAPLCSPPDSNPLAGGTL